MSFQLETLSTVDQVEALRADWQSLWDECPDATPFQTPEWMLAWWHHLGGGELRVFVLRDNGRLAGLAPLFLHVWQGRRQMSPLGVSVSDYFNFLARTDHTLILNEMVWRALTEHRYEWDVCILPEIPAVSPLLIRPGTHVEPSSVCPVLALPDTLEEFRAGLTANYRRNLRRGWRQMDGARIEQAETSTVDEFMQALFRLHSALWQTRGQAGVVSQPSLQMFHREVAAGMLARSTLRLYSLRYQNELIAVLYAFACHGRMYGYLDGFDPRWQRASPGTLLIEHAIEQAIGEHAREYDFLRGPEEYKYRWGAFDRQNYRIIIRS